MDKKTIQPSMQGNLDNPTSFEVIEDSKTSSAVIEESKMLDCCSNFLSEKLQRCYKFEEPPEDPAVQINKELYIICEAASQLIVYVAKIENGRLGITKKENGRLGSHDQLLTQKFALTISDDGGGDYFVLEQPPPWHLVFSSCSSKIYAVSNTHDDILSSWVKESKLVQCTKPTSDPFSMVFEVDDKIVALMDTLRVFYHDKSKWVSCRHRTDESLVLYREVNPTRYSRWRDRPLVLNRKVQFSGYAVLGDDSFIVSDAATSSFLLFDLHSERWSVLHRALPGSQLLNGRSVFVDGFIYTCTSGGILAYELVDKQGNRKGLRDPPIFLPFSWQLSECRAWEAERMCFDCVDKDKISDAIIFCVVQGEYCYSANLPGSLSHSHDVHITTVQVKTERACRGKRKPERIDHVDIGTCFIEHDAALVLTKSCFAVGS